MIAKEPQPLLDVRGLRVGFGGRDVVHSIDFHIMAGEKLALVGESGSGKTVSALSLLRLVHNAQVSGSAHLNGRDLLRLSEHDLRGVRGDDVAIIFQEPMTALNPLYSIGNQIGEVLQLKKGLTGAQASAGVVELLAATGIPEPARRANAFPHQLSGGQRQRAMIAMALASSPKLLLADEPTTALDVSLRGQILDLLSDLQRQHGMAVLLITHDLNLVQPICRSRGCDGAGATGGAGHRHRSLSSACASVHPAVVGQPPPRVMWLKAAPDPEKVPALSTEALRVTYPVPLPGLRGWFKKGVFVAVQGANLHISPGQTLGVVGESGSGKSTLALAALGLLPYEGALQVGGSDWRRATAEGQARALRQRIQVVFQDPFSSLSPRMTVEQIVGEGLTVHAPEHERCATAGQG